MFFAIFICLAYSTCIILQTSCARTLVVLARGALPTGLRGLQARGARGTLVVLVRGALPTGLCGLQARGARGTLVVLVRGTLSTGLILQTSCARSTIADCIGGGRGGWGGEGSGGGTNGRGGVGGSCGRSNTV